jgi:hypothetical protein
MFLVGPALSGRSCTGLYRVLVLDLRDVAPFDGLLHDQASSFVGTLHVAPQCVVLLPRKKISIV